MISVKEKKSWISWSKYNHRHPKLKYHVWNVISIDASKLVLYYKQSLMYEKKNTELEVYAWTTNIVMYFYLLISKINKEDLFLLCFGVNSSI